MKRLFIWILSFIILNTCIAQSNFKLPPEFAILNDHFSENNYLEERNSLPLIHKNDKYSITFASTPLGLSKKEIALSNPFEGGSFPLAFSFIYKDQIVSLFDEGNFACHNLQNFERNYKLEEELNVRKFDYAWLIDGLIIAKYNYEYFKFESEKGWTKYDKKIPFCNKNLPFNCRPKLFEDEEYLVFQKCQGEFGGNIFFYEKSKEKVYQTEATCANSIIKKDSLYNILSHLGHGPGTSELQLVYDPKKLTTKSFNKVKFDYWSLQTFSSFEFDNQTIYMVFWRGTTFLATFQNNIFYIVDPLFDAQLYTHDPITIKYNNDLILMNLDFYGKGREKEVSCILIQGKNLTKINWKEK